MIGGLLGGKSKKINVPATGYNALPDEIRTLDRSIQGEIYSTNPFDIARYQPTPLNRNQLLAGQVTNYDQFLSPQAINQTALQFQNPYQAQVIDELNRQAMGADSISRAAIARAGGLGSNRDFLASSDVEAKRQGALAQLLGNQFETSRNLAIGTGQGRFNNAETRRQELIGLGDVQNQMAEYGKTASLRRLQDMQGVLNGLLSVDRTGTDAYTYKKKSGGLGGILGKIAAPIGLATGQPWLGAALGAAGGAMSGGGIGGALTGGFSGYGGLGGMGGGTGSLFNGLGQSLGRFGSGGVYGPVQPIFGR